MIVLWILLGLIALIFLLCIPVRFNLNYNGETTVFIRYLFFKIPRASRTGAEKEKKPSEKSPKNKRRRKNRIRFCGR